MLKFTGLQKKGKKNYKDMYEIMMLPVIAMAVVMFVVMANVPDKLSRWLYKKDKDWKDAIDKAQGCKPTFKLKLLSCELCLTFWISLIYLLLHRNPCEAVMLAGAAAYLTGPLKRLL